MQLILSPFSALSSPINNFKSIESNEYKTVHSVQYSHRGHVCDNKRIPSPPLSKDAWRAGVNAADQRRPELPAFRARQDRVREDEEADNGSCQMEKKF